MTGITIGKRPYRFLLKNISGYFPVLFLDLRNLGQAQGDIAIEDLHHFL